MLIDSHAHLSSLDTTLQHEVIARAKESGIVAIVNIATTPEELIIGLQLKEKYPWIYLAASTTPHDVEKWGEEHFDFYEKHQSSLIAIGETGLDYHYKHSPKEIQQAFLRRYLHLAQKASLPVIFHCRDAFQDLFQIVKEENYTGKALLHCFTGTLEEAFTLIDLGWSLSFSGIVTFKKSDALKEVAKQIPLEHLVIETDAPYLAPLTRRGQPNEPSFLNETAHCIATLRHLSLEEFAHATVKNTRRFFSF